MEAEECAECDIRMTSKRRRKYNKDAERLDPRLRGIIESGLDALRSDPSRGPGLEWNLAGPRSVHADEFACRTVYKADHALRTVTIAMMDHRDGACGELARLRGPWAAGMRGRGRGGESARRLAAGGAADRGPGALPLGAARAAGASFLWMQAARLGGRG